MFKIVPRELVWLAGFLAWLVALLSNRPAVAQTTVASAVAPDPISLDASMLRDPEAVACLTRVCLSAAENYAERQKQVGACKADHQKRVINTLAGNGRPGLVAAGAQDASSAVACLDLMRRPETDPLNQADKRLLEKSNGELASAERNVPAQILTDPIKDDNPYLDEEPPKKEPAKPSAPPPPPDKMELAKGDQLGLASCAPRHLRVRYSSDIMVQLWVDKGANWWELQNSCLAKRFKVDAKSITSFNSVEKTIPWWMDDKGRVHYDETRYQDVLSGKRKLERGGRPNLEFFDKYSGEGYYGVAFQGYETLVLFSQNYGAVETENPPPKTSAEPPKGSGKGAAFAPKPREVQQDACQDICGEQNVPEKSAAKGAEPMKPQNPLVLPPSTFPLYPIPDEYQEGQCREDNPGENIRLHFRRKTPPSDVPRPRSGIRRIKPTFAWNDRARQDLAPVMLM